MAVPWIYAYVVGATATFGFRVYKGLKADRKLRQCYLDHIHIGRNVKECQCDVYDPAEYTRLPEYMFGGVLYASVWPAYWICYSYMNYHKGAAKKYKADIEACNHKK